MQFSLKLHNYYIFQDEGCRAKLAGPGVRQQLRELHAVAPVSLLPQVNLLLKKLGHASQSTLVSTAGTDSYLLDSLFQDIICI